VILRGLSIPGAWLAAALFALHPVQVESVAWITERKNVLSGCFYLSAILVYLRFLRGDGTRRLHWGYYALALVLYLCALLSKTVTCTMPAALLLVLWWRRDRIGWRTLLLLIPHFVVGAALALTTVWMEKHRVGAQGEEWALSFMERCLVAGRALWFYAGKLFWPFKLTFIYPRWQIDAGIWWQYLFPLAAIAVFIALWLFRSQIGKAPLTAVLFFAGTLTPALGFFDIYPMRYSFVADHFQYLASIGVMVLCSAVITVIIRRRGSLHRIMGLATYGVMIVVLGMRVWQQGHIYKDAETLWRDTISKNPHAWMAYNNLGEVLVTQGKLDQGIEYYKKCLAIKPDHAKAYNNLGIAYGIKGRLDEAIPEFEKALAITPRFLNAHMNLGKAYYKKGELDKALSEYKRALLLKPRSAEAHNNLGAVYFRKGMLDEAISEYKKALAINPNFADAHNNLGITYYHKGNYQLAIVHCDKAVKLGYNVNPKFLELLTLHR